MATLYVRNIPDDLYERLQELAASQHRSISAQVIALLEKTLPTKAQQTEDGQQNVAKLLEDSRHRRQSRRTDVKWPDSTAMIREDRDR